MDKDYSELKKPELLMPAGSLPVLKTAVIYGADAVYIGGEEFSLRAAARNFTPEEIREGIEFAHSHGVKVYLTANILAHNSDLKKAEEFFQRLKGAGVDAFIISDPGMFDLCKKIIPDAEIHISTQANNTNSGTFSFWHSRGAKRAVAARELSLTEIKEIREEIPVDMEIECFVHGAMCISYSGRCLLSAFLTGRSANMGACTHPCRWRYSLMEETRPGEYMPVFENERGTYIFNSKDLCMIEHIPELIDAGVSSFKVEGRMKSALYVATICRTYRMAIDDLFLDPVIYRKKQDVYLEELSKCTFREYTTGFFFGKPDENAQIYTSNTYIKEWIYLGTIGSEFIDTDSGIYYALEQKNKFSAGDSIEVMKPDGRNLELTVLDMLDENGAHITSCPHPKQKIFINTGCVLEEYDILRKHDE